MSAYVYNTLDYGQPRRGEQQCGIVWGCPTVLRGVAFEISDQGFFWKGTLTSQQLYTAVAAERLGTRQ